MNIVSIDQVVKNNLCIGCGACVSESDSSNMEWNRYGFLVPKTKDVKFNDMAIKVCPFSLNPDNEVENEDKIASILFADSTHNDPQIGRYEALYVGYSEKFRVTSSSGGIATHIFEMLLETKTVDYLFVVSEIKGSYEYQFFSDLSQITNISKTRYIPVTLEGLFDKIDNLDGKVAVSGVACFIKAIRLKQYYNPKLKTKIAFVVGIICGGVKSRFFTEYLSNTAGIPINEYHNQEYRIKENQNSASDYSFGAYNMQNQFHSFKMNTVGDMWGSGLFKANACDFCDDVTTELADISLGDAWLHPYSLDGKGTSVVVTRSKLAEILIKASIEKQNLNITPLNLEQFKLSQRGSFNHRHAGLKYRIRVLEKDGIKTPSKRKRFLVNIPIEFKTVQKTRMKLREQSLICWKQYNNAELFNRAISSNRNRLKKSTLFYHRIQRIKKILKLRTI